MNMHQFLLIILFAFKMTLTEDKADSIQQKESISQTSDFEINGFGDHANWEKASWITLELLDVTKNKYDTKCKVLYSETGLYMYASCEDRLISTSFQQDQGDIWNGDVFEVFLQTDEKNPLYFEYEINPLGAELAILVPNKNGEFFGWSPWHYEGERKVKKIVRVYDGNMEAGSEISKWTAEIFIPYALFRGLRNVPPKSGTKWKANFCRLDYDSGKMVKWSWSPIETTFHEYKKYRTLLFK